MTAHTKYLQQSSTFLTRLLVNQRSELLLNETYIHKPVLAGVGNYMLCINAR